MPEQLSRMPRPEICTTRRAVIAGSAAILIGVPQLLRAQQSEIWSARDAHDALSSDLIRMIDVRSRVEWSETAIATGAWPISLHEDRFVQRLFEAKAVADGRPVAVICATGGRSGYVMRSLRQGGYDGFIDVSEGMLGSDKGPGWIAAGLPTVSADAALEVLPAALL